jgi:hypothetical protein
MMDLAATTLDFAQVGTLRLHKIAGIARAECRFVLVGDAIDRISRGGHRVFVEKDVRRAEVDVTVRVGHHLRGAAQRRCYCPVGDAAVGRVPDALAELIARPVPNPVDSVGLIRIEAVGRCRRAGGPANIGFGAERAGARIIDHAVGYGVIPLNVAGGDRRGIGGVDLCGSAAAARANG